VNLSALKKGDTVYTQGRLTLDGPATDYALFRVESALGSSVFVRLRNRFVELDAAKLVGCIVIRDGRTYSFTP